MAQKNTNLDSLLGAIPVDDLAKKFGVDASTMQAAVQQALPALVGGMAVNASDAEGAKSLNKAVEKHAPAKGKIALDAVDTADGEKIVGHVLGDKKEDVALALGQNASDSGVAKLIPLLLPLLAPIVMQWLSGKLSGAPAEAAEPEAKGGVEGVLGDVLGGLLGGGQSTQTSSQGGLGDLLGGLLGGGSSSSSSGGLGGLLGGLLGK